MEEKQLLDWINVFKVNRKIKSRLWPWIKIILSIILFFAVFYGDIYVHILDKTKTGRIVEALILVVFSFLDYLICFISVAEMDCLKDRRYAAAKESGEFYTVSEIEVPCSTMCRVPIQFITGEEAEDLLSVCAQERQEIRWKWAAENIS